MMPSTFFAQFPNFLSQRYLSTPDRICGRSIESRTGSSYFCKHCDANVGEFDRDERFTIEWTIDDGIHQIRAVGRDTVSEVGLDSKR